MTRKQALVIAICCLQFSDNGIGYQNDLIHRIPTDQRFFRRVTRRRKGISSVVIMGRATADSVPHEYWPLQDRDTIVISTKYQDGNGVREIEPGVYGAPSPEEALAWAKERYTLVWVAGGEDIYKKLLYSCDFLLITEVFEQKAADRHFPMYDSFIFRKKVWADTHKETKYRICLYEYDA